MNVTETGYTVTTIGEPPCPYPTPTVFTVIDGRLCVVVDDAPPGAKRPDPSAAVFGLVPRGGGVYLPCHGHFAVRHDMKWHKVAPFSTEWADAGPLFDEMLLARMGPELCALDDGCGCSYWGDRPQREWWEGAKCPHAIAKAYIAWRAGQ